MKARLIVNPVAGEDLGAALLKTINDRLRDRVKDLNIVMTVGPGDAEAAAREAVESGCDLLFVAGGDGTLNEALNGAASHAGGLPGVTFGVLPLGTGNDFAAALGIPAEIESALDVLLEGHSVVVDVGLVNGRRFVNASAGGFIAEVSEAVSTELKTAAGRLAYLLGGARILLEHEPVGVVIRGPVDSMTPDPAPAPMRMQMFCVSNGPTIGGGHIIAPAARIDDGSLDAMIVEEVPALEFLALLRKISTGNHLNDPRVRVLRVRELDLEFERPVKVNTDGQVFTSQHCRYRLEHRAARFLSAPARPLQPEATSG